MSKANANKQVYYVEKLHSKLTQPLDGCHSELMQIIDTQFCTVWKANTCRAYLNSLRMFVKYLMTSTEHRQLHDCSSLLKLLTIIAQLRSRLYNHFVKERITKRKVQSIEDNGGVNPADFQGYFMSDHVNNTKTLLQQKDDVIVTKKKHTAVRNFIMMCIAMKNPHRTGTLMNMAINEVKDAKERLKNGCNVILISNHKTSNCYGPAEVICDTDLYSYLTVYVQQFRPATEVPQCFVTWPGQPMDHSIVIQALSSELGHAGIEKRLVLFQNKYNKQYMECIMSCFRMTCTQLRHVAATLVSALLPEDAPMLAKFMCHSSAVQQASYNEMLQTSQSVRMSKIIGKILLNKDILPSDLAQAELGMYSKTTFSISFIEYLMCLMFFAEMPGFNINKITAMAPVSSQQSGINESEPAKELASDNLYAFPTNITVSQKCSKVPTNEINWLARHVKCKAQNKLPALRELFATDSLFQCFVKRKWPNIRQELRLRRVRDLLRKYQK